MMGPGVAGSQLPTHSTKNHHHRQNHLFSRYHDMLPTYLFVESAIDLIHNRRHAESSNGHFAQTPKSVCQFDKKNLYFRTTSPLVKLP